MTFATFNEVSVTKARVQIPAWGCWFADVDLDSETDFTGAAELVIGGVTMAGTILSGGSVDGRSAYRVVAGAGGWGSTIAGKGYSDDGGVKAATLIADAASAAGETIGATSSARLGSHFARIEAPARSVLGAVAPRNWYVDFGGVTQIGARPEVAYEGDDPIVRVEDASGVVELAPESAVGFEPGLVIEDRLPATDIELSLDAGSFTVLVYSGSSTTRRLAAFASMLDALDPRRAYRGSYDYRVVTQEGERLNLQPVRSAVGLPDLARVSVRPGMAGLKAQVMLGSVVLVTFVDADPSRPVVISHEEPDGPGWMPLILQLGEDPVLGGARVTDPVIAGPWAGTITSASARVKVGL